MSDPFITQVAADQRKAGLIGIAWQVEQVVQSLGLMDYFVDENGDGPFIQALGNGN